MTPLPAYIDDVFTAELLGVPLWELYDAPFALVAQARAVLSTRNRIRDAQHQPS